MQKVFEGNNLISTDISHGQIKLAISKSHGNFKVEDAENMSFVDESFDHIIGNSILHHVDADKCLHECYRVLKRGGKIFFTEPNMLNPEVFIQKHVHWLGKFLDNSPDEAAFYRWQIKENLIKAGFNDVVVENFDFLHPLFPKFSTTIVNKISRLLEKIPLIKEISGSLIIHGKK